ncbi:hypothetical protein QTO34_013351, partial [Cnephaeus nilssonii]
APTFQLRQHLELVRKLAVEVVLDAVQLPLIVLHGHADPPSPPESPPAPKLPRHSCAPLPPPASRRRQCTVGVPGGAQPLVGRQGRAGAGLRAQAGWGRVKAWSPKGTSQELAIGPPGCPSGGVGGEWPGVGGALRAGRTWKEVVPWPERKVRGRGSRGAGTGAGSGRVSGIGDPDGAARLQVGSKVGGGGLTAGIHPEPFGHRPTMEPGSVENLSIVYQSRDFLVVNKHWDVRIDSKTFCHQLDFSTSGALCVALNKAAAGSAYKCFKERRVTKAYLALVRGHIQESRITISHAIGRNSTEGRTHTMCIEGTQGCENPKPSLTELVVLEHGLYAGDPVSKVLLQPLTGRTHQLRVHCSALSHPIVGDLTYGQASGQEDQPFRMMLHAFYLRIPTQAECVEACTPDPFVPTLDACWSPHTLVQPLDQLVQVLRAARDPEPTEGGPGPCSPSTHPPRPGRPPPPHPPETEAQRASYLQWLSEWTLEPDN